jgi:hypothetical protein
MTLHKTAYSVGWYKYTQQELEYIFPIHTEYREQVQSIVPFGLTDGCWKDTPQEAQQFLDQIISVNSTSNIRALTQGEKELFIIKRESTGQDYPRFIITRPVENG